MTTSFYTHIVSEFVVKIACNYSKQNCEKTVTKLQLVAYLGDIVVRDNSELVQRVNTSEPTFCIE